MAGNSGALEPARRAIRAVAQARYMSGCPASCGMGSDNEADPEATSAAPRCTDMSLDAPRFAGVKGKNACRRRPEADK